MKKIIYISILSCLAFKASEPNCLLKNGKYKVVYDEWFSNYPKFEFELDGQKITEINSDNKHVFKLEILSPNSFRMNSLQKQKATMTDIEKTLLSYGNPYFEIINCKKDTIFFTKRINLHVTSYTGKFVKID